MNDYMHGKNPYQGSAKKALFVCTGGILRSPTAAHYAAAVKGWNTRSCGVMSEAIPPVHANLLEWADMIYCLERQHMQFIHQTFGDRYVDKIRVLDIPDNFAYRDRELLSYIAAALKDET